MIVRAERQANAEISNSIDFSDAEKSKMPCSHSPKDHSHWDLCNTRPLSKTNFVSSGLFLKKETNERVSIGCTNTVYANCVGTTPVRDCDNYGDGQIDTIISIIMIESNRDIIHMYLCLIYK